MKLIIGQTAPDFTLPDQDENSHKLSDYRGKWALLYFYPKDDTPGCTKEACGIRDNFPNFSKSKVTVLGVSVDPIVSHRKFVDKYHLPFTLLSDVDKKVVNLYGVWGQKSFLGRKYMGTLRTSFLIDPKGKIAKIYEKVNPSIHATQVLQDMSNL